VQWWGVAAPKGTPVAIIQRLHKELMAALNSPEVKALMNKNGASPSPESATEFVAFMKTERARIANVGKQANIRLD
jgi:tripartite-type tricarboxylate transporter receptor subunit TctC